MQALGQTPERRRWKFGTGETPAIIAANSGRITQVVRVAASEIEAHEVDDYVLAIRHPRKFLRVRLPEQLFY
jgi:hypothetical protein